MGYGIDYTGGASVAALKAARIGNEPISFTCRYVGYFSGYNINDIATPQGKCLTPGEAKTLSQAGIAVVSNYEWYGNRAAEGYSSGVADAQLAQRIHTECGGPADRPIYFSVDFDTGATTAIIDYFHGVASVIDLERTGAYGGYACIKGLLDAGAIKWAWQTYAWSGGQWANGIHIKQYQNGVDLDGHSVDYDESMQADFGQWMTERNTWVSEYQEAQALATWNSSTAGALGGGLVADPTGILPKAPDYTTGIAQQWQRDYMNGNNHGAPTSYEFSVVDGKQLTDWGGNPISQQNFLGGRYEHNIKTHAIIWYPWK